MSDELRLSLKQWGYFYLLFYYYYFFLDQGPGLHNIPFIINFCDQAYFMIKHTGPVTMQPIINFVNFNNHMTPSAFLRLGIQEIICSLIYQIHVIWIGYLYYYKCFSLNVIKTILLLNWWKLRIKYSFRIRTTFAVDKTRFVFWFHIKGRLL